MESKARSRSLLLGAAALVVLALVAGPASAIAKKPKLRIDDAPKVTEPASGATLQKFKVSIDHAVGHPVTFDFQTYDGTATAGSDYGAASGSGQIEPGKRASKVIVQVNMDYNPEPTEAYGVAISNVHGARLSAHRNASGFIKDGNKHESEPNNVFVRANPVDPATDAIGAHFSLGDTDFFTFTSGFTGSEFVATSDFGDFSCSPGPGQIDTLLTVFDGAHNQITQNDDHDGLCSQVSFPISTGQTYYLRVTDGAAGGGSIFDYTLRTFSP